MMERKLSFETPYFHLGNLLVDTTEDQSRIGLSIQFNKVRQNFANISETLNGYFQKQTREFKRGQLTYGMIGSYFSVFYLDQREAEGFCVFCENPLERPENAIFDFLELREGIVLQDLYTEFLSTNPTIGSENKVKASVKVPCFSAEILSI